MVASCIELQRLVQGAVFLLNGAIVGNHIQGKFALLDIDLLQNQADGGDGSAHVLFQGEIVIVSVTLVLQYLQLGGVVRDEAAGQAQVADRLFQLGIG